MTTKRTLSVHQPEDILGYIPHMLGYWPEDCLVAITMQGKVLGATLRVDLPSHRSYRALAGFAEQIRGYLMADEDADAVVFAIYTDAGWADGSVVKDSMPLLEALRHSLEEIGVTVRDAWLLGAGFWRSAYCDDERCCPFPGSSVERIKESRLSAELVYMGSSIGPSPQSRQGPPLPDRGNLPDPLLIQAEFRYQERLGSAWRNERCLDYVLAVWQHVLTQTLTRTGRATPLISTMNVDLAGFLRATLTVPAWRDAVVVMAAAGRGSAKSGAAAFGLFHAEEQAVPPFDASELGLPGSVGAPAGEPGDDTDEGDVYTYGDVLMGLRPAVPDWKSLDVLQRVLSELCVDGESGDAAAAAMTLLGWISWCKGSGSIAHAYLSRAEAARPGYRLAELLSGVVEQGTICEWARSPTSAWRRPIGSAS